MNARGKMDDNMVVFPRKLVRKFLQLYKELPCLWDRQSPSYKNKLKRHDAISKLTQLVQEHFPEATRVHTLRKIESLRACVRREYKRVIDSREKASHPEEVYTPQLWYYNLCSFVFGEDGNNYQGKRVSNEPSVELEEDQAEDDKDNDEILFEQSIESYPAEYNVSTSMVAAADNPSSSKRYTLYEEDSKSSKRQCTEVADEYDAIGVNVAAKLRGLPANMKILAEKLINDVLFQAQMNGLSSSTVICTPDPFKQDG